MGIPNLLKELRVITKSVSLSNFSGETCGVDASCWLHRASHSCALALVSGRSTTKYLEFTLRCIQTLLDYNITPIIVFDGAQLQMKANEEHRRNQIREDQKKEALRHIQLGNSDLAWKSAQAAVRITKEMVTGFINQCIEHNIQFICAPYEADSQLGYMYKNNQIDFVITEDSDLLLFGVHKALYKFDPNKKCGQLINMNDIYNYKIDTNITDKKKKTNLCLFLKKFWTKDPKEFVQVCVLAGCDYVKNLRGIGIKTAVKYCTENRNIEHLLETLMIDKFNTAPNDYPIQFKRAVLTFCHQIVYDSDTDKLVHLNPLTPAVNKYLEQLNKYLLTVMNPMVYDTTLDFLGKITDDDMAKKIAMGKVDARSGLHRNLVTTSDDDDIFGGIMELKIDKHAEATEIKCKDAVDKYLGRLLIQFGYDHNTDLNNDFEAKMGTNDNIIFETHETKDENSDIEIIEDENSDIEIIEDENSDIEIIENALPY
eukprot:436731_1